MSRATRPRRHVRGTDRERLRARVEEVLGRPPNVRGPLGFAVAEQAAKKLHTRAAIVRRVLLGLVVSMRAVARLQRG